MRITFFIFRVEGALASTKTKIIYEVVTRIRDENHWLRSAKT